MKLQLSLLHDEVLFSPLKVGENRILIFYEKGTLPPTLSAPQSSNTLKEIKATLDTLMC